MDLKIALQPDPWISAQDDVITRSMDLKIALQPEPWISR